MSKLSPSEERDKIINLLSPDLRENETFYAIGRPWWETWCSYVGLDPDEHKPTARKNSDPMPGPIDNRNIVQANGIELRKDMEEHRDFELIHSGGFQLLVSWYGISGPPLPRKVILVGLRQEAVVEKYPVFLKILFEDGDSGIKISPEVKAFSQHLKLSDLLSMHAPKATPKEDAKMADDKKEGRVWVRRSEPSAENDKQEDGWVTVSKQDIEETKTENSTVEAAIQTEKPLFLLSKDDLSQKLDYFEFSPGAEILLEYQKDDGSWARNASKKDWKNFAINDVIDAQDTQKKWYESTIRDVKGEKRDKILVHFNGWTPKWDEWFEVGEGQKDIARIAPRSTYTNGAYIKKAPEDEFQLSRQNSTGAPMQRGAVGLRNLGNTCFMNSTLQCLSNTPGLTEYFVENRHLPHINRNNPLGWGGKVAEAYVSMVQDIWSNKYKTIAPRQIKDVIGEFQPRFSGYAQHDSSELLSFLLDGLHEDLNTVKDKPPTSAVESNGRPDKEVAEESWKRHLMRNQSVIVDNCQGQLKSRVVCPDCGRESITFDPFMFLSVPLPQLNDRYMEVVLVRAATADRNVPPSALIYGLKVPKMGSCNDLKNALASATGGSSGGKPNTFLLVEVFENRVFKVLEDDLSLQRIRDQEAIFCFDLPPKFDNQNQPIPVTRLQVTHRLVGKNNKWEPFGEPCVIAVPRDQLRNMSADTLRTIIADAAAPYIKGGWGKEKDSDLYTIVISNKNGEEKVAEVPVKREDTIDLATIAEKKGLSFLLLWNPNSRKRYNDKLMRHPSAAKGADRDKPRNVDIFDCIEEYTKEEVLRKSEAWFCSKCKGHKMATKKFDIWKTPDVLIIHLKRFSYNRHYRDKLDTMVDFPVEGLDVGKWVANPDYKKTSVYDLYAVSNHYGGCGGGHYTAFARNILDHKWYNLDDSHVSPLSNAREQVRSKAAYVLFYKKRKDPARASP